MSWLLPPATALVIIVLGVLLLTSPLWMHNALRLGGSAYTGIGTMATPEQSLELSDRVVRELFVGPGTFNYGHPDYFRADEAAHLRDARLLLWVFIWLALASLVCIVTALVHRPHDARRWRAVARGGAGLAVGTVVVGVIGYFAFDPLFELFHRVFFPGGNWEFPGDSNMIRLYPYAFWQITAAALGIWCVVVGGVVWWFARRRAT